MPIHTPAHRTTLVVCALLCGSVPLAAQTAPPRRALSATDLLRIREVGDPQVAPSGNWVAYTVTSVDSAKNRSDTDIWMTSWDGSQSVRLTYTPEREDAPRWSPDGRYLAFLSGRQGGKGAQVWLLDRRGGEAQRITSLKDGLSDLQWSPDSRRLVLVAGVDFDSTAAHDSAHRDTATSPKPIVIDRFVFKRDVDGYLTTAYSHLLLVDVASRKVDTLTAASADDAAPRWSPDGSRIAFVRTPPPAPGTGAPSEIDVVEARPHGAVVRLSPTREVDHGPPAWSPDGSTIAFVRSDDPRYYIYPSDRLAIALSDGSAPARILTDRLDRTLNAPTFTADGRYVRVLVVDDRAQYLARVSATDGSVEREDRERHVVEAYSTGGTLEARTALLVSSPERPYEVFAVDGHGLRQLSRQNDSLVNALQLAPTADFNSRSADGTSVHGLLVKPFLAVPGVRLPLILRIHGGPDSQDNYAFNFDRQYFAANGYAVLAVNYRGSVGRGTQYSRAIFADWGHKEVIDLLGAVDEVVRSGVADPDRLGIGGWSYGGILTDYAIATTTRFKAATSGAGSALQLSMYGVDEYAMQYDLELGPPWKSQDLWIKLSYPFFHADRIKTPTLFMGGQADFNVPIIGGEQMYQALKTLGIPTQLVIYPGQFHEFTLPSFLVDRVNRYLAWYDRYLKGGRATTQSETSR